MAAELPTERLGTGLPPVLLALGYLLFFVAGVLAAVLVVLLIPFRIGATLIPIAPVLAVAVGAGIPALARGLTDSLRSAVAPALGQVLTVWLLSTGRPEGDVLMPAGSTATVAYAVLILGTLVPLFTLGLASRPGPWQLSSMASLLRPPRRSAATAPGSDSGDAR